MHQTHCTHMVNKITKKNWCLIRFVASDSHGREARERKRVKKEREGVTPLSHDKNCGAMQHKNFGKILSINIMRRERESEGEEREKREGIERKKIEGREREERKRVERGRNPSLIKQL